MKALNLLIHDLRAPLSVAQGYLRLLHQDKLETDSERQRAFAQAMEALGRIGRLCEDAAAFADAVAKDRPIRTLAVSEFVEQVREACAARGTSLSFAQPPTLSGVIRGSCVDDIAQSVAVILGAARRSTRNDAVRVSVQESSKEVRFLLGCDDDRAALESGPGEAFDPWRGGHGIALPLACRTVTGAGGRIWTCASEQGVVGIALPEEASVP